MIGILTKRSSFLVEGEYSECDVADPALYYDGSGNHHYPRDENGEEVQEEEVEGYLR